MHKKVEFYKYHGNGNDFILLDNRSNSINNLSQKTIATMCHRRFGIGADGLILLNNHLEYDFEMKYYNSDGNESTMCGNGGRCIIKFAYELGVIKNKTQFMAIDGPHDGELKDDGTVHLKMKDVNGFKTIGDDYVIDTGSPHYVKFVADVKNISVTVQGREIRNQTTFKQEGINVNFVEVANEKLSVRTYERGVEDETLSCGTGVVASALIGSIKTGKPDGKQVSNLDTPGGPFRVSFVRRNNIFSEIWLIAGAVFVYNGVTELL